MQLSGWSLSSPALCIISLSIFSYPSGHEVSSHSLSVPLVYLSCFSYVSKILNHLFSCCSELFSCRLPISFLIWSCGFLSCSFICSMFLCLFILFNLLRFQSPLWSLEGCSPSQLWSLLPWVGLNQCLLKISWLVGFVSMFFWMELDLFFLKVSGMSNSVFLGVLWAWYGFGKPIC